MTEPIKATYANDLAVAKAAGIDAEVIWDEDSKICCRCTSTPERQDFTLVDGVRVAELVSFSPTTDERHAMEAAEAVGLFDDAWTIWEDEGIFFMQNAEKGTPLYAGETFALMLCEAILAMAETKGGG